MAKETVEYDPYLYQITHRGNPGDVRYYTSACRGKDTILELGCGGGRIMRPLLQAGHHVTGIDIHQGMLDDLHTILADTPELSARATLHNDDIRSFSLEARFDRILLPFNLLFCLLTHEDITRCLKQVAAHLKPGGACLFDIYQISDEELTELYPPANSQEQGKPTQINLAVEPALESLEEAEENWEEFATVADEERQIQMAERREWCLSTRRLDAYYRYRITEWNPPAQREEIYCIPQIYLHPATIEGLCEEAGLFLTQRYGDFHGTPWDEESEHFVAWAMRK